MDAISAAANPVASSRRMLSATQKPEPQSKENAIAVSELGQGIKVTLSARAQERAQASKANHDVEQSELPESIKGLLKRIRELKAQIAETQAQLVELQRAGADPERIKRLQQQLSSLAGALTDAYTSLAQAIEGASLSVEQKQQAATLSMA